MGKPNDFSLTAFSDEIVKRIEEIERRQSHMRRGRRAIHRKAFDVLGAKGWTNQEIRQFINNCADMAELNLNAD